MPPFLALRSPRRTWLRTVCRSRSTRTPSSSPRRAAAPCSCALLPSCWKCPPTPPGAKVYSNQDGMVFYTVEGVLGYHVPILFDDFINAHGGMRISGKPIAEVSESMPGVYRQCFAELLPGIHPRQSPRAADPACSARQPLPRQNARHQRAAGLFRHLTRYGCHARERGNQASFPPGKPSASVLCSCARVTLKPIPGLESVLQISLPDGSVYESTLPATSAEGTSSILIPALTGIPNGSILPYQVCLSGSISEPVCAGGSYIFWTKP